MNRPDRRTLAAFLAFFALMACVPPVAGGVGALNLDYALVLATKVLIFALFAVSLDVVLGYGAMVSLGHAAFFGVGAYAAMMLAPEFDAANILVTLPAAVLAATLAALVIGALVIRTSGMYFIMATLAFGQMGFFFVHDTPWFGGSDGVLLFSRPVAALGDAVLLDLQDPLIYYYTVLIIVAVAVANLAWLLRTPFGRVLGGIAADEDRMRALGVNTHAFKLAAFTAAGGAAGCAGYLAAYQLEYVSPAFLSWHESGLVLMMVILGGRGTLAGPAFGALAYIAVETAFQDWTEHWMALLGAFVIAVVLSLPNGLLGSALRPRAAQAAQSGAGR
jgi:branched-chain amino acid transport system permease protein